MSDQGADVRSLAQLNSLRERCTNFRVQTLQELETFQAEVQKLTRWIDEEVPAYWQQQLTLAERRWTECREVLMRCEACVRADEKRPCTEERKHLEKATARRTLCQEKLRAAREAALVWQRHVFKLRGRIQSAGDMADANMQVALVELSDLIQALETYARGVAGLSSASWVTFCRK